MKNNPAKFSFEIITINDLSGNPMEIIECRNPKHEGDPERCLCCGKRIDFDKAIPVIMLNRGHASFAPWGEWDRLDNLGAYYFGVSCAKKIPAKFKGEAGVLPG
jgi:hypothetical protein